MNVVGKAAKYISKEIPKNSMLLSYIPPVACVHCVQTSGLFFSMKAGRPPLPLKGQARPIGSDEGFQGKG